MGIEQLGFIMAIALVFFGVYSSQSKRNKLLCHFTGKDKTEEDKWVNIKDGNVVFRNLQFDILPERITSFWLTTGIHWLFPTRVNYCKYSWYSRFPHDPNNYKITLIDPSVRRVIDKQEWAKSYAKQFTPQNKKSEGTIMKYLPLVAIILVIIVGVYMYSNLQTISMHLKILQDSIATMK